MGRTVNRTGKVRQNLGVKEPDPLSRMVGWGRGETAKQGDGKNPTMCEDRGIWRETDDQGRETGKGSLTRRTFSRCGPRGLGSTQRFV